jgi:hypothetical protein
VRKRRILVTVGIVFIAGLALRALLSRENEPASRGQPLSYWVLREDRQHEASGQKAEADAAIREIGTNALPLLFKWIQHKQPRWRRTMWKMSLKLPTWSIADRIKESRTDILARNSSVALRVLGPQAAPITGELILLLTNAVGSDPWLGADLVLLSSGTNALPAITEALKDPTKTYARGPLLATIRSMHPPPETAAPLVPLMIKLMDEEPYAALTLGTLRTEPKTCVPALLRCLGSTNFGLRYYSTRALTNFPSEANTILPALTNLLSDKEPGTRRCASNSISGILSASTNQAAPQ